MYVYEMVKYLFMRDDVYVTGEMVKYLFMRPCVYNWRNGRIFIHETMCI